MHTFFNIPEIRKSTVLYTTLRKDDSVKILREKKHDAYKDHSHNKGSTKNLFLTVGVQTWLLLPIGR